MRKVIMMTVIVLALVGGMETGKTFPILATEKAVAGHVEDYYQDVADRRQQEAETNYYESQMW